MKESNKKMNQNSIINFREELKYLKLSKPLRDWLYKFLEMKFMNPYETVNGLSEKHSDSKSSYRALNNDELTVKAILRAIQESTYLKMFYLQEPVLLIQDTTSINYHTQKKKQGNGLMSNNTRGVNVHTCLVVTTSGVVLGMLSQSFISREEGEDSGLTKAQKKLRPIEMKESSRWGDTFVICDLFTPKNIKAITVCDREGDIYEFISMIQNYNRTFLIRQAQNRLTTDDQRIFDLIKSDDLRGEISVKIPRDTRRNIPERDAILELRYNQYSVKRPATLNKNDKIPKSIDIYAIHVKEKNPLHPNDPLEWFLMTNEPITSNEKAIEYINYYKQRQKIEQFHKVLKSEGCNVEKSQARTMKVTEKLITIYSIITTFLMNLKDISKTDPNLPCDLFFDEDEWKLLYCLATKSNEIPINPYTAGEALFYLSCLGGPKRAPSGGPPGYKVIWKGYMKLLWALKNMEIIYNFRSQKNK
jgi:hypothetical protein